jgi:signal transduction histidine kinase
VNKGGVLLRVSDDGRGPPENMAPVHLEMSGHMGLAGMRERITTLGGTVRFRRNSEAGAQLEILLPSAPENGR